MNKHRILANITDDIKRMIKNDPDIKYLGGFVKHNSDGQLTTNVYLTPSGGSIIVDTQPGKDDLYFVDRDHLNRAIEILDLDNHNEMCNLIIGFLNSIIRERDSI
jgi:hypothetical protein